MISSKVIQKSIRHHQSQIVSLKVKISSHEQLVERLKQEYNTAKAQEKDRE